MKTKRDGHCECGCQKLPLDSQGHRSALAKSQHTPTPWKVNEAVSELEIQANHIPIAYIPKTDNELSTIGSLEEDHANADFIVRAVNAHEELLAALKHSHNMHHALLSKKCDGVCIAAEAIAKAEGK